MATSCNLLIVKLAHREKSDFIKENLNNKNVGLLEGNINVIQNFCPSSLIRKNAIPFVEAFSGDIELISPRSCRDCRDSYCDDRRFMCSSSTYFLYFPQRLP